MSEKNEGRVPKYTDVFKTQLVAESRAVGATAPMISKRHNVPVNRIYAWRQDERYQSAASEEPGFTAVEVAADRNGRDQSQTTCEGRIEITLENGCRISIRDDVDAGFVLELARGLAA